MFRSQARADERQQHFIEARDALAERRRLAAEGKEAADEHEACSGNMVQSLPREALLTASGAREAAAAADAQDDEEDEEEVLAMLNEPAAEDCAAQEGLEQGSSVPSSPRELSSRGQLPPTSDRDALIAAAMQAAAYVQPSGPTVWCAQQSVPQQTRAEAIRRLPSRKTLKQLQWTTKLWHAWEKQGAIEIDERAGPTWEQVSARRSRRAEHAASPASSAKLTRLWCLVRARVVAGQRLRGLRVDGAADALPGGHAADGAGRDGAAEHGVVPAEVHPADAVPGDVLRG